MKRLAVLALLLAASCGEKGGNPADNASYALSLPVEPAAGAQVQRVELPAAALVAMKRTDRGDVRLFDGHGKVLSIARLAIAPAEVGVTRFDAIPFNPQQGSGRRGSVSVRVDREGEAVTVDSTSSAGARQERSVLFDTRQVKDPAVSLALNATLPVQRPVSFTVRAGSDLNNWDVLAEQVLFRPGQGAGLLGSGQIALDGEKLASRYLLVSWSGAAGAEVTGAELRTTPSPPPPRLVVPTNGMRMADAHTLEFAIPPGPAPAAMHLALTGSDGVVPVSLFGRNARELPWTPLSMAVLRQGESGATLDATGDLREYKIEADARSGGFSQAPRLEFRYDPVTLLVAFNGQAPYKLAVGNADAAPAFLNVADLTPQPGPYPTARVIAGRALAPIQLLGAEGDSPFGKRNLMLWGTLLLGVAVLAAAAIWLMRAGAKPTE